MKKFNWNVQPFILLQAGSLYWMKTTAPRQNLYRLEMNSVELNYKCHRTSHTRAHAIILVCWLIWGIRNSSWTKEHFFFHLSYTTPCKMLAISKTCPKCLELGCSAIQRPDCTSFLFEHFSANYDSTLRQRPIRSTTINLATTWSCSTNPKLVWIFANQFLVPLRFVNYRTKNNQAAWSQSKQNQQKL